MPVTVNIPEAGQIRRLAASLATSLAANSHGMTAKDLNISARVYFGDFPWTGERIIAPTFAVPLETSTVGQYFRGFNWEGRLLARSEPTSIDDEETDIGTDGPSEVPHSPSNFFDNFFEE